MRQDIIIAGFGGQGIMLAGQVLATAGMLEGQNVVWSPSYGPEMRGGPAHCTVILSHDPVGSPVVSQADAALILDEPSLGKFEGRLRPGGLLLINSSLVRREPARDDIGVYRISANVRAEEAGDVRAANMVMLGALHVLLAPVGREALSGALRTVCAGSKARLIPLNERALEMGRAEIPPKEALSVAASPADAEAVAGKPAGAHSVARQSR